MIKYLVLIIMLIQYQAVHAAETISNAIMPVRFYTDHIPQLKLLGSNLKQYGQASIIGVSGMGKTQLARMFAAENQKDYNLIWFLDCSLDLNEEFLKLAKKINSTSGTKVISEDAALAKKEILEWLTPRNDWLLVFDNLKINDNKKIKEFVGWEHNGNVIFCSQDSEGLSSAVEMVTFSKEDAIALAKTLLEDKNQKSAEFLAEEMGGYPVLIVQGAQLFNKIKGLGMEEYKNKIKKSANKIGLNLELAIGELTPGANVLLHKIALVNNQSFSKEFLGMITDSPNTVDGDIYQLSKFMLISSIDHAEDNPIFEMHDIVAQKIMDMSGSKNNKRYLEDIITRLVDAVPQSVVKGRVFRNSKTMLENFEGIFKNAEKYGACINKIMELNSNLAIQYANSLDFYNMEGKIAWFNKNDQDDIFNLSSMNNDQRARYAAYLGIIGSYYRHRYADYNKAVEYFVRSNSVFDDVKGYDFYKFNAICQLALVHIGLGQIKEATKSVHKLNEMSNSGLVDKGDIAFAHYIETRLLTMQGKYTEALEHINNTIEVSINNGLNPNDLFLTSFYLQRADIFNWLGKYDESYIQAEQVYNMHKSLKREDNHIFGRIFVQMARSELGLKKVEGAKDHITKAISIFLADVHRKPKEAVRSEDPDLAVSYLVEGDIFFKQNQPKKAIQSYEAAQSIYSRLYNEESANVAHMSYLYTQGAKAACKLKDSYYYERFGKAQVEEFGLKHPNTIAMLKYCSEYNMKLPTADD